MASMQRGNGALCLSLNLNFHFLFIENFNKFEICTFPMGSIIYVRSFKH